MARRHTPFFSHRPRNSDSRGNGPGSSRRPRSCPPRRRHRDDPGLLALVQARQARHLDRHAPAAILLADHEPLPMAKAIPVVPARRAVARRAARHRPDHGVPGLHSAPAGRVPGSPGPRPGCRDRPAGRRDRPCTRRASNCQSSGAPHRGCADRTRHDPASSHVDLTPVPERHAQESLPDDPAQSADRPSPRSPLSMGGQHNDEPAIPCGDADRNGHHFTTTYETVTHPTGPKVACQDEAKDAPSAIA
jgi:hypothetical protein